MPEKVSPKNSSPCLTLLTRRSRSTRGQAPPPRGRSFGGFGTCFLKAKSRKPQEHEKIHLNCWTALRRSYLENVPPGCEGLLALPYFMGERAPLWDPQARGAWFGLTLSHTKAHLFRALLEATAFALRHAIEEGKNIGLPLEEETIVVGGVANSDLWLSILADVTGRPIRTLATQGIGAPLADAFLVGLASGIVSDCRQIREWLSYTEPILPDSGRHAIYDRYYALYRSLYEAVCPKLRELSELSEEEQ